MTTNQTTGEIQKAREARGKAIAEAGRVRLEAIKQANIKFMKAEEQAWEAFRMATEKASSGGSSAGLLDVDESELKAD